MRGMWAASIALLAVCADWGHAKTSVDDTVTVCLNLTGQHMTAQLARGTASRLLGSIGIKLEWQADKRRCAAGGIVIDVSIDTPAGQLPGALAFAKPYDRTHIVVFLDRVQFAITPNSVPVLLGYVMAHEIGHILQGVSQHSREGIMKQRWEAVDYQDMRRGVLKFSESDVSLIRQGLAWRRNPAVLAASH